MLQDWPGTGLSYVMLWFLCGSVSMHVRVCVMKGDDNEIDCERFLPDLAFCFPGIRHTAFRPAVPNLRDFVPLGDSALS